MMAHGEEHEGKENEGQEQTPLVDLPKELLAYVGKYLPPHDLDSLRQTCQTMNSEFDAIKVHLPDDKWKQKLAKLESLKEKVNQSTKGLESLGKWAEKVPPIKKIHPRMRADMDRQLKWTFGVLDKQKAGIAESFSKAKNTIAKLKTRKVLEDAQTKTLDALVAHLSAAEKSYENEWGRISALLKQKETA
jgi:sugar diacid utilization regulator